MRPAVLGYTSLDAARLGLLGTYVSSWIQSRHLMASLLEMQVNSLQ